MLANIKTMLYFFGANFQDILVSVIIMVSAIIVAIGVLKPVIKKKITNKYIRKVVLFFGNIAACFLAALVYFLTEDWNLDYYFLAAIALTVCSIVTYALYEHTCLRELIGLVGSLALSKAGGVFKLALTTDDTEKVRSEIKNATAQLKTTTKQELKKTANSIKVDKDLKGL